MSKKLLVGLIVAFVFAAALPMVAQAQPANPRPTQEGTIPAVKNCKYVGPVDPLSLNTVSFGNGDNTGFTKTVKVQKEIFYCYDSFSNIPDDKTLQDPLANRDKIGKGLRYIVEIEIFAFIAEQITGTGDTLTVTTNKSFQVVRCVKERRTPTHQPGQSSTMLETWVLAGCQYWGGNSAQDVPTLPTFAARGCVPEYTIPAPGGKGTKVTTKQPFVHGPIPVEDPIETNTVLVDYDNDGVPDWIKTVNVNKEVFRCAFSGDPTYPKDKTHRPFPNENGEYVDPVEDIKAGPVIWDIEIYTEEIESATFPFPVVYKDFEVAYCAKYEPWALLMGCQFNNPNETPFAVASAADVQAMARPFVSLKSVGLRQGAGQYVFEAQGYNIEGVQVQVYNLSGKQVFSAETGGTQLSWNGLSSDGRQLANGVYLYVMTVKGTYGDVVQTKVQKLAILR